MKLIFALFYIQKEARERGLSFVEEEDFNSENLESRFQRGVDIFNQIGPQDRKDELSYIINEYKKVMANEGEDAEGKIEDALNAFMTLSTYMHVYIATTLSFAAAAYGSLLKDPSSGPEIIANTLRALEKRPDKR